jgi:hypothetical protein
VIALNVYPGLHQKALTLLDCADNHKSINEAIARWDADELEEAAGDAGLVIAKVRSTEEFFREQQYQQVLQHMPLISVERSPTATSSRWQPVRQRRWKTSAPWEWGMSLPAPGSAGTWHRSGRRPERVAPRRQRGRVVLPGHTSRHAIDVPVRHR